MNQRCSLYATYQYELHGELHQHFLRIGETYRAHRKDAVVGCFYSAILGCLVPVVTLKSEPRETYFTEVKKVCIH